MLSNSDERRLREIASVQPECGATAIERCDGLTETVGVSIMAGSMRYPDQDWQNHDFRPALVLDMEGQIHGRMPVDYVLVDDFRSGLAQKQTQRSQIQHVKALVIDGSSVTIDDVDKKARHSPARPRDTTPGAVPSF
jgi:hypothetical protein